MATATGDHHVAFGTKDAEATVDFSANRLGMPLVHCGELLGFFALGNVGEREGWRTEISTGLGLPRWVNHVAFDVDSTEAVDAIRDRAGRSGLRPYTEADRQPPGRGLELLRQDARDLAETTRKDTTSGVRTGRGHGEA